MSPIRRVVFRRDPDFRAGRAGRPGGALTKIERPPLRARSPRSPWSWATGWATTSRCRPRVVREGAGRRIPESRVREPDHARACGFRLWINYSQYGNNLRHSPEICLPSGGWKKVESECRVLSVRTARGKTLTLTRLGYAQGESGSGGRFLVLHLRRGAAGALRPAAADYQPEQPRADDPRVGHDRRGFLPRRERPGR